MVQISRRPVEREVLDRMFSLFFEVVGRRRNQKEFERVLRDLLSPAERVMLGKRIAIVYLLLKEIDTGTICEVLKVTRATVAKYSFLKEKSEELVPIFNKMLRNEKIADMFIDILQDFRGPGVPGVDWRAAWQDRRKREIKKQRGI